MNLIVMSVATTSRFEGTLNSALISASASAVFFESKMECLRGLRMLLSSGQRLSGPVISDVATNGKTHVPKDIGAFALDVPVDDGKAHVPKDIGAFAPDVAGDKSDVSSPAACACLRKHSAWS